MDSTQLRYEKIRLALAQAQDRTQFHGRLCVALAAVSFAAALSSTGAGLAGQLSPAIATSLSAAMLVLTFAGVFLVRKLQRGLDIAYVRSLRRIDRLILKEGEDDHDGTATHES